MALKSPRAEMPNRSNRGSFVSLAGLLLTAGVATQQDKLGQVMRDGRLAQLPQTQGLATQPARGLTEKDWAAAATAWRYFEDHYRSETGFVDAIHDHPSATLWDQGSYLLALLAAEGLGIIDLGVFERRCAAFLSGLERLSLFDGQLPNKAYDTRSLAMVDYANTPVPDGIGWSALDVARLLMALRVLEIRSPSFGPRIRSLLAEWDLAAITSEGRLWGSSREDGQTWYHQEGRIGYEQYAARAAALWGLDVLDASTARPIMVWEEVSGVDVAADRRRGKDFGAITPVVSEPYIFQAFEIGLNGEGQLLASRIYQAQETRARQTCMATIVSEDHIDQAPHFLYGSVFGNGSDWAVVAEDGSAHPELRTVSLKAAFGWDALYGTKYTQNFLAELVPLAGEQGWHAGLYERDGRINTALTLNTNAVVLEALHFKLNGPLLTAK